MGLLSKALGLVSKVAPILPIPGAGLLGKVAGLATRIPAKAGGLVAAGAAFEAGSQIVQRRAGKKAPAVIDPRTGKPFKRHHRRGLSGRDIEGCQRVARVVRAFGMKPKYHKRKGRR